VHADNYTVIRLNGNVIGCQPAQEIFPNQFELITRESDERGSKCRRTDGGRAVLRALTRRG
jgi:hypothetical protein